MYSDFFCSKKIHHSGDKVYPNEVKALLTNNKVHPNEVKALMTNGIIKNSSADLKPPRSPPDDDENDHANVEVQANETSIMNLLLAAAAKSQKQPNGMAKAVCTKLQKKTLGICAIFMILLTFF